MKILLYPDTHHKRYNITTLQLHIDLLGIDLAEGIEDDYDVLLYWSYHKHIRKIDDFLIGEMKKRHIINIGGWNALKGYSEEIMKHAFGYNTIIDPFTYKGAMAEKTEMQSAHNIKIISSLKKKKEGCIYVKLIDNRIGEDTVRDYRVFVHAYKVDFVAVKDKPIQSRFGDAMAPGCKIYACNSPYDVFTDEEIKKMGLVCKIYHTEFTQLDVVRDTDGRIYVLDNNNVPAREPFMVTYEKNDNEVLKYLSNRFYEMLERYKLD